MKTTSGFHKSTLNSNKHFVVKQIFKDQREIGSDLSQCLDID